MTGAGRLRGERWIEAHRSPRYDVWVGHTQVASPWYYRLECMELWDRALGRPLSGLDGQAARAVLEQVAAAAGKLRLWSANPEICGAGVAAQKLEWMRHLCAVCGEWVVRVDLVEVVSYFELVEGALEGSIKPELAVRVAMERGGSEDGVRKMLRWAEACAALERRGGARTARTDLVTSQTARACRGASATRTRGS